MSHYAENAASELADQGAEFGRNLSDFERMLESHGYTESEWAVLSNKAKSQILWNWKTFGSAK